MSISNLEVPNNLQLYCDSLNANNFNINTINATSINTTSVIATSVTSSVVTTNTLHIGGGASLTNYIESNTTDKLTGPWASGFGPNCTLKLSKLNNTVTISQTANLTAVQSSASIITFPTALPVAYRPTDPALVYLPLIVFDNGAGGYQIGLISIDPSTGIVTFYKGANPSSGNFSGTSNAGIPPFSVSYNVSN
jgi:hypothetical protein